ncbi:hypothetical protein [Brevundimonas sp.]|uniref:hypothetical protein n=1 Tax=Brevundimonas sp. TaxID=1871086 RepID=UPI002D3875E9|nr:hypothetical protein [Brevundimonas sp.]HYD26333.1 hypothetical protein [Brevundimonas sp.]
MITSEAGEAPAYVDICHRAALMYAFTCLVLAQFAGLSVWPEPVNLIGVAVPWPSSFPLWGPMPSTAYCATRTINFAGLTSWDNVWSTRASSAFTSTP